MRIDILTIFPELFVGPLGVGILRRAVAAGQVAINTHDIRSFSTDKHRCVDDAPYGGGAGMVMRPEPVVAAIESIPPSGSGFRRVLLCAQGRRFTQSVARELAEQSQHLVLVCPRYEGIDERVREGWIDDQISIGDYILMGGEVPALVLIEAVVRLLPGVLGNPASLTEESFAAGGLEYPHYTRPPVFQGRAVPEVLQSGDHGAIAAWRTQMAQKRTLDRRPDLVSEGPPFQSAKKEQR